MDKQELPPLGENPTDEECLAFLLAGSEDDLPWRSALETCRHATRVFFPDLPPNVCLVMCAEAMLESMNAIAEEQGIITRESGNGPV